MNAPVPVQADRPPFPDIEVFAMNRPIACGTPFLLSNFFHRFELPELVMTNLGVNNTSAVVMTEMIKRFGGALLYEVPVFQDQVKALFCAPSFTRVGIDNVPIALPNGQPSLQSIHFAMRKMLVDEARLMLNEIYDELLTHDRLPQPDLAKIMRNGLVLVEFSDDQNRVAGEADYDWQMASQINQVRTLQ